MHATTYTYMYTMETHPNRNAVVAGKGKDATAPPDLENLTLNEPRAAHPHVIPHPHPHPLPHQLATKTPGAAAAAAAAPHRPPVVPPGDDLESASEDDEEEEDDDNPFADKNVVVGTPAAERHEPRW